MRKLLIALVILIVLLGAAVVVGPSLIPTEVYRDQIAEQAKAATGRDLTVAGDIDISIIPLRVQLGDVSFANAEWGKAPQMAKLRRLVLDVDLVPLLSGQLKVDSFILEQPDITIEINKQGRGNWEFAGAPAPAPGGETTPAPKPSEAPPAGAPSGLSEITLGDVRLDAGKITFIDHAAGTTEVLEAINMKLDLPSLLQPFKAEGGLTWHGEALKINASTGPLAELLFERKPTKVAKSVSGNPLSLSFDGTVTLADVPKLSGALDLDVPSIRELAAWTGNPLPKDTGGTGLGPLKIAGTVGADGPKYSFTDATINIDAIKSKGALTVNTAGARPNVVGNLDVEMLDLNPYLGAGGDANAGGGSSGGSGTPAPTGSAPADEEWSKDPIDLSGLKAADAAFDLRVGGIRIEKIKVGEGALAIRLKDGRMLADLQKLALYSGAITGKVNLDGAGAAPAASFDLDIDGVRARPLLTDAADMSDLEGIGNFDLGVTTRGKSQYDMVRALNGKGAVSFKDGALYGNNFINVVMFVVRKFKDLGSGNISGLIGAGSSDEAVTKTEFSELGGTFTITNGILRNDDFKMLAPLARLQGKGTANIPAKTLDYLIKPKVVGSMQGQGGSVDDKGLGIDVKVTGPWSKPKATPILLSDPGAALGTVTDALKGGNLGETLKNAPKDAEGLLKGLGGGGGSSEDKPAGGLEDAGKALKGLFGR